MTAVHPSWCIPDQCLVGVYPAGGHAGKLSTVLDDKTAVEVQLHQRIDVTTPTVILAIYENGSPVETGGLTLSLGGAQELGGLLRRMARIGLEAGR